MEGSHIGLPARRTPIDTRPEQLINALLLLGLAIREVYPLPIFLKQLFNPSLFARGLRYGPAWSEGVRPDRQPWQCRDWLRLCCSGLAWVVAGLNVEPTLDDFAPVCVHVEIPGQSIY